MVMRRVRVWQWSACLLAALLLVFWAHRREAPERLPSPLQASNGTCVSARCHAGMDDPHRTDMLRCVDCHGGNPNVPEPKSDDPKAWLAMMRRAHVATPKGMTAKQMGIVAFLDRLPSDYIRFVNPSDLRVAERTCGQAECHGILRGDVVRRVKSVTPRHLVRLQPACGATGRKRRNFRHPQHHGMEANNDGGSGQRVAPFWGVEAFVPCQHPLGQLRPMPHPSLSAPAAEGSVSCQWLCRLPHALRRRRQKQNGALATVDGSKAKLAQRPSLRPRLFGAP